MELTYVVARALPFTWITVLGTKFAPVTVMLVGVAVPVLTMFGVTRIDPGEGLLTARVAEGEVPPPGAGVTAVTGRHPNSPDR